MNKLLILPGFSLKNKDWALDVQKKLAGSFDVRVVEWEHWKSGEKKDGWIEKEVEKVLEEEKTPISIIAKSIGTVVAALVIKRKPELVEKLIVCGIPLNDLEKGEETVYNSLKDFDAKNILCIQNTKDPHGSFEKVKSLITSINPTINSISKDRDDHEYPYSEEFIKFLQEA